MESTYYGREKTRDLPGEYRGGWRGRIDKGKKRTCWWEQMLTVLILEAVFQVPLTNKNVQICCLLHSIIPPGKSEPTEESELVGVGAIVQ